MLPSFTQSFLKPKLKRQRPLTSKSYPRLNLERTEECMDVVDYAENNESENLSKRQRPNERVQVIRIPALDLFDQHQYQHAQATSVEASMLTKPTSRPDFFGPFGASSSSSYNECNSSLKPQSGTSGHSLFTRQQITRKQSFIVKGREMRAFFRLLEDESVQDFLEADSCMRISDKYLIAMVFAYFKRAELKIREYTRTNFFVALYLGNDMEEDEEEDKYEIFPWALGLKWQDKFPRFLKKRDLMWSKINYMALVSKRCCEEIMAIDSSHPVWKRTRPIHHAGALRSYMRDPDDDGYPRGPHASPRHCEECNHDSQYDSASPASVSWFISSGENSPTSENDIFDEPRKSRFDMNKLKNDLPQQDDHDDDDAWPSVEE